MSITMHTMGKHGFCVCEHHILGHESEAGPCEDENCACLIFTDSTEMCLDPDCGIANDLDALEDRV